MKNRLPHYIYIFLILVVPSPLQAQQITFNEVLPPDGNSWGRMLYGITQDAQGYMWFTNDMGLHRYDGYHLTSYTHDPSNPRSLITNEVDNLYVDHKGYIWVGTYGAGLDKLNPATGIFTHFRHQPAEPASLSSDTVTSILEDHDRNLWVGTQNGLNKLDQKTGKFTRYLNDPMDLFSLSKGWVTKLYEDRQGTLWIGTNGDKDFSFNGPGQGGLNRLDRNTGKFIRYLHDPGNLRSLVDNRVQTMFEDSDGNFWVGTFGAGVHIMDRKKGVFERYLIDNAQPGKLSQPSSTYKNTPSSLIGFITEDAIGVIWIGTYPRGLYRYDVKTQKIAHYESDSSSGFTDKNARSAYTSREGVLWISTWEGGLFRMDPRRSHIPHYATGFPGFAICEDRSGSLWFGDWQGGGLIQLNRGTGNMKRFLTDTRNSHSLSNDSIRTIYEDSQGTLWIGTGDGLNRFNPKEQSFTHYRHDPKSARSLTPSIINAIYEDRQGSLWVGNEKGLNVMNRKTGEFTHYRRNLKDSNSLSSDTVICITEDRSGNLWIGTIGGVDVLDRRTGKFKHHLGKTRVFTILEDKTGIIWAGTSDGLYRLNKAVDRFALFIDSTLGIKSVTHARSILEDNQENIWIGSFNGIFKLNSKRNGIRRYGKNDGVYFRGWAKGYKGPKGELFFANPTGYYAFFPDRLIRNVKPPQVVLSEFRVGDQPVKPGRGSLLGVPLAQAKEIRLHYNQNIFSFDFAGIHYSSPEDNRHLFMLENLDKNWRKGGAEKTAYYYNVPPGRYIFRVKAASTEGVWAEKAIDVIIAPPWWRTWWAYVFYGVCFLAGLFLVDRYQRRRIVQKERERTRERELAQAREIEKAYRELKTTQAQLIQSEKMASLGELTAGIAHEIQNPLNFVNNFSEVNDELINEMKQELKAGNEQEAITIANDIEENNLKITHHGKRADAIVKGMLQHSRTSSGQKEPTDINALVDEYLRLSYHGLRAKDKSFNATLKTDFDPSLEKITVIPQDIGRVLLNLYNNAFYAVTEKKKVKDLEGFQNLQGLTSYEPTVLVSTKKINNRIEISVKDNGNGISQNIVDKIFHPFFTTKPTGKGTGLGLSLSYDIIKAHGGELRVQTREGEGAEFIVELPFK